MSFIKISEQSSLYDNLEQKSVHELLVDMNTEDKKVALAVEKAIPQIEALVEKISTWRFTPATDSDGNPVASSKTEYIDFRN